MHNIPKNIIGSRLAEARKAGKGLTQQDLAENLM